MHCCNASEQSCFCCRDNVLNRQLPTLIVGTRTLQVIFQGMVFGSRPLRFRLSSSHFDGFRWPRACLCWPRARRGTPRPPSSGPTNIWRKEEVRPRSRDRGPEESPARRQRRKCRRGGPEPGLDAQGREEQREQELKDQPALSHGQQARPHASELGVPVHQDYTGADDVLRLVPNIPLDL